MSDKSFTEHSRSRVTFSHDFFADYHTALITDIRADDNCNDVYTGVKAHPLIDLQKLNQSQILAYKVSLVAEEVSHLRPFLPAEIFIHAVKLAAQASNTDPSLAKY